MATTRYTKDHEWVRLDGNVATVGITNHAQEALGDIVFVELPEPGREVAEGEACAVVESVKAASDVYAPLAGRVSEVSTTLVDEPGLVNSDPTGKGWFFKLEVADSAAFEALMSEDDYRRPSGKRVMDALVELAALENQDGFVNRHIGPSEIEIAAMLTVVGAESLDDLATRTVPASIRATSALDLPPAVDEAAAIAELRALSEQNSTAKSLIGMGYHGTHTPPVILRNVLENPGWYTAYTPYQSEVAQGRLEALLNFQTLVCELTGMAIANASLLDEGTACAEAVAMAHAVSRTKSDLVLVAADLHPQTRAVLATRAAPLGLRLLDFAPGDTATVAAANACAVILQYPGTTGAVRNLAPEIGAAHEAGSLAIVCADPAVADAADLAGGDGRRRGGRVHAALRRADGIWRAACRVFRDP